MITISINDKSVDVASLPGMLTILFVILKVNEIIDWSWVWVMSPIWAEWIVGCAILLIRCLIALNDNDVSMDFFEGLSWLMIITSVVLFLLIAVLCVMSLGGVMTVVEFAWWSIAMLVLGTALFLSSGWMGGASD